MTSEFARKGSGNERDHNVAGDINRQDNMNPEDTNRRSSTCPDTIDRKDSTFPDALERKDSSFFNSLSRKFSIFPGDMNKKDSIFPVAVSRRDSTSPDVTERKGSTGTNSVAASRRGSIFPESKIRRGSKFADPKARRSSRLPDAKFKVLLLGDMGVGKTSIFFRIKDDDFSHLRNLTLGLDMCVTRVCIGDAVVEVSLCDTAGSERYRTLTRNFYRNAQAILFVYSVDNPASLYGLGKWDEDARMYAPTAVRFLVGNKSDLSRAVNEHTMSTFASSHDCEEAFVVSARTGDGVSDILSGVSERLLWRYNEAQKDLEASWMDDTVNIYKGEEIPGLKSQPGTGCCK